MEKSLKEPALEYLHGTAFRGPDFWGGALQTWITSEVASTCNKQLKTDKEYILLTRQEFSGHSSSDLLNRRPQIFVLKAFSPGMSHQPDKSELQSTSSQILLEKKRACLLYTQVLSKVQSKIHFPIKHNCPHAPLHLSERTEILV